MSGTLNLNCVVLGDGANCIFPIQIAESMTVGDLKDSIKAKKRPDFDHLPADKLRLWKVSILVNRSLTEDLSELSEIDFIDKDSLSPVTPLSMVFLDKPEVLHLHIVVQLLPAGTTKVDHNRSFGKEESDIITDIVGRYSATILKVVSGDTPSKSAKSPGYRIYQRNLPIYDGRYDVDSPISTTAPPIQLFHTVFGHFLDDIADENLDVPHETLRATACFMAGASGLYEREEHRKHAIFPHLAAVLSTGMTKIVNLDLTATDGAVLLPLIGDIHETVALLLAEDTREIGEGGPIQAGLSMIRFWAQKNHRVVRDNTCCPTFLLASGGPWLTVLGAIFTDKVVVQRLTDFVWVGIDTTLNEKNCYRVAHILHCLGRSLRRLSNYYLSLTVGHTETPELHPRYFPSIRVYRDAADVKVNFTYVKPLERDAICVTFLAKTLERPPKHIVVKFVERYGEAAHKLLEEMDAAPRLLYYGKAGVNDGDPTYGDLHMVVMEYVDGMTANEAEKLGQLPPTFLGEVRKILGCLHENNFVFGDLRSVNIMITRNNKVMFIDFDWAGEDGVSRYPLLLSPVIQWSDGVGEGLVLMKKEHDLDMLKRLL